MSQREVFDRKLAQGRAASKADALAAQGAERAWPLAMARAARDSFALGLEVIAMKTQAISLAELLDEVPEQAFIAVLEGPAEQHGVMVLAPDIMAGLIQVQTLGRVLDTVVQPRKPTRTDAAILVGWLDLALVGLENALAFDADLAWADGFRYASFLDDPRPLGLLLEDMPYRLLTAEVTLAHGARTCKVLLALPAHGRGRRARGLEEPRAKAVAPTFEAMFGDQVMGSEGTLRAIIARISLPLGAVLGLSIAETLPLEDAAIDRIVLEGVDGRPFALGRLGQFQGHRAVRITDCLLADGTSWADPGTVAPSSRAEIVEAEVVQSGAG
jgi:flagellar motor switch protein FliM